MLSRARRALRRGGRRRRISGFGLTQIPRRLTQPPYKPIVGFGLNDCVLKAKENLACISSYTANAPSVAQKAEGFREIVLLLGWSFAFSGKTY
jgi:hypothetical protein